MKRGTPEHPKIMELAEAIFEHLNQQGSKLTFDLCQSLACGIFERLTHFTARYSPAGDIGKHSDLRIARAVGWTHDATWLIDTLARCKMLDVMSNGARWYVHDWHDHSDEAADKWLHSKGLEYANGSQTRTGKKSRDAREPLSTGSRLSESESKSESGSSSKSEPKPESGSKPTSGDAAVRDPDLEGWVLWWNELHRLKLVASGLDAAKPSKAVLKSWSRVQKDPGLRAALADREALRREIVAAAGLLKDAGWFTLPKLFGGCNGLGEVIAEKLLAGSYRDKTRPRDPRGNLAVFNQFRDEQQEEFNAGQE